MIKYLSTRGEAPPLSFTQALLTGLAPDGGLYLPDHYPHFTPETIKGFAGKPYAEVATQVIAPFVGDDLPLPILRDMIEAAYAGFRHPAVTPLSQIDSGTFLLELFHGPTLAFKDVAMQLLGRLMDHVLKERGARATIVGATSGDTGAAAIEAFRGLEQVDVFILYPHGRVSDVQRRQMTTVEDANIHAIALEGTFDDAQAILKGLFQNEALRQRLNLSGVNSINWARVVAQSVYYFTSAVVLGAPHRPVSYTVPTGNFGDILAGWIAKRMGLAIDRLVIATNANDILVRALAEGRYEVKGVQPTQSPSMDIQVSSNFERLLFEAYNRDASSLRRLMAQLGQSRGFTIDSGPLETIRAEFDAISVGEADTTAEITRIWRNAEMLIDPHTAVGMAAAHRHAKQHASTSPMVVLGTAHPAKFPDAMEAATGLRPPLPEHLAEIIKKPEHFTVLPNDQAAIESFLLDHARAARQA
ncbi:threonine synthase [Beijerinckia indica subsp. indica ATCC 9039]|uniref:Threonine synthase n=1 Tax=Beijerinckia indica subsp. indica (strain ATCC 9039 / DSM 1715 / NCIMB 8712) TaxID=395963 RepID=B2IGJ0_BEII9|nr:threonine synthase [Beijerinckia indica subsp. indica ATCC 9039]